MKGSRFKLNQNHAPIHEALETFRRMRVVPFDVPGHKRGRGNPELTEFLGQKCVGVDVNSMKPLDNLCHPVSVIREAEELAADAFGAAHAFLMVGGTTSSVQTMVLTACKRGDEIILPRNDLYPTFLKILPAYYDRSHPTERDDWLVRKNQMDSVHQLRCTLSHQPKQGIK